MARNIHPSRLGDHQGLQSPRGPPLRAPLMAHRTEKRGTLCFPSPPSCNAVAAAVAAAVAVAVAAAVAAGVAAGVAAAVAAAVAMGRERDRKRCPAAASSVIYRRYQPLQLAAPAVC